VELLLAAVAAGVWYIHGDWETYGGGGPGPWPLLFLGLLLMVRLARSVVARTGHRDLVPPAFALPMGLFVLSAGLSLRVAYDPGAAAAKAWLIVGALGIYWATAGQTDRSRLFSTLSFWALFATGIAAVYLISHDWSHLPLKLGQLGRLLEATRSRLPSAMVEDPLNPNVVAGVLTLLLPFFVPLLVSYRQRWLDSWAESRCADWRCLLLAALLMGALAISLLTWLLTGSRGAWLALAVTIALWSIWRLTDRLPWRVRGAILVSVALLAGLSLGYLGQAVYRGWGSGALARGARDAISNRAFLAQYGALLARDTPFTGIGLGMFEMHFSIYTLLVHVGFVNHSHNMLVDMVIEQGFLGAIAYSALVVIAVGMGIRALRRAGVNLAVGEGERRSASLLAPLNARLLMESTLASLFATLLHGLVDDPLYGSRFLVLLFVPFGMLIAAIRAATPRPSLHSREAPFARTLHALMPHVLSLAVTFVLGALVIALATRPWEGPRLAGSRLASTWYANLGAIAQARVELASYDQRSYEDLTIDQVRRQEHLKEAVAFFEQSLRKNPDNVTANQRLAALALSQGRFDEALLGMQHLWETGARDRVTRLLYGDALVSAGRLHEAAGVVQGLTFARSRLQGQAWSRYTLGGDTRRADWAAYVANQIDE
jgi:O-antigen ligase/predicted negative regulator of RcsB-dependent stress response